MSYNLKKSDFNIPYLETLELEKQVEIVAKYCNKTEAKAFLKKHGIKSPKKAKKDVQEM